MAVSPASPYSQSSLTSMEVDPDVVIPVETIEMDNTPAILHDLEKSVHSLGKKAQAVKHKIDQLAEDQNALKAVVVVTLTNGFIPIAKQTEHNTAAHNQLRAAAKQKFQDHSRRLRHLERSNRMLGFAIKAVLAVGAIWALYSCLNPFGSSSPQKTEL